MERHLQTQTHDLPNSHATFASLSALSMNWNHRCSQTSTTITDDMSGSVKGYIGSQKLFCKERGKERNVYVILIYGNPHQ